MDWTGHRHQAGAGLWGSTPPSPSEIRKNIFDNYNVIRVNATRRATPTAPPTGSHRSSALLPLASAARASRGVASPRPPHQECKAKPCPTLSSPNGELRVGTQCQPYREASGRRPPFASHRLSTLFFAFPTTNRYPPSANQKNTASDNASAAPMKATRCVTGAGWRLRVKVMIARVP